jgi:hypothetical protein
MNRQVFRGLEIRQGINSLNVAARAFAEYPEKQVLVLS